MITLERGDITLVAADVIVNAANARLAPGGGVCGAIHAAGGPAIAAECRAFLAAHGPLAPGEAAITSGGRLAVRWVVHAAGPVWRGGHADEAETLASAYRSAVRIADAVGAADIAFPSISTGIFGYPVERAAPVAMRAVRDALVESVSVRRACFVLFDDATHRAFAAALEALEGEDVD
jgi:O-acetyl-ADP-ribose deacetylase (regulator of RNase III)